MPGHVLSLKKFFVVVFKSKASRGQAIFCQRLVKSYWTLIRAVIHFVPLSYFHHQGILKAVETIKGAPLLSCAAPACRRFIEDRRSENVPRVTIRGRVQMSGGGGVSGNRSLSFPVVRRDL